MRHLVQFLGLSFALPQQALVPLLLLDQDSLQTLYFRLEGVLHCVGLRAPINELFDFPLLLAYRSVALPQLGLAERQLLLQALSQPLQLVRVLPMALTRQLLLVAKLAQLLLLLAQLFSQRLSQLDRASLPASQLLQLLLPQLQHLCEPLALHLKSPNLALLESDSVLEFPLEVLLS